MIFYSYVSLPEGNECFNKMHQKHHRKPCNLTILIWLYTSTSSKFPAAARPHVNSSMGLSENNVVSCDIPWYKITDFFHMGVFENSVPLNPMVNDH